jgi:MFS family permease
MGSGFSARFWLLIGATFLGFLGMGTVLPAMAPHVRYDLGASDRTVGWVIGIFSFVALGSRFFSGPLADRRGRKIVFIAGLVSCALAGMVYLLPLHLKGAFLGRALQGFGEACLYTGAAAWAVEVAGVQRSSQSLGYLSSAIWGGISAGPAVGHWVGSFQHAALLQVVAATAACALALFVREDFRPSVHHAKRAWLPSSLFTPGIAIGFVNVHYPVITGFLILHLAHHGGSGPAAFSAYALTILFSRFFLGRVPDLIHPSITFYTGLGFMACGLIWIGTGPRPRFAIAAAILLARVRLLLPMVERRQYGSAPHAQPAARLRHQLLERVLRSLRRHQFFHRRSRSPTLRLFHRLLHGGCGAAGRCYRWALRLFPCQASLRVT